MAEVFGRTAFGLAMKEYSQPSLYEFSETLQAISEKSLGPNRRLPLPDGWSIAEVKGQSTLLVDQAAALRFPLAFGHIGSLKITESYGTGSPFCAQVILRLPFRYGSSPSEMEDSWVFCRVNAFSSCACLPSAAQGVRVGQIVSGVLAKSSHEYHTAQLVGWSGTSASDWKMLSPRTFPVNGIELSLHDVYRLPALNRRHFPSPAEPPSLDSTLALQPDAIRLNF